MARVIEMPKLSDTMEEGGIANWLKKEGDSVNEGEPLVEIETDKATQEFESPEEGTVLKILVQPGKTVPLHTPIAVIGAKGEKIDLAALTAGKGPAKAVAPKAAALDKQDTSPAPAAPAKAEAAAAPALSVAAVAPPPSDGGRVRSSPLARKVAADKGLDLAGLHGSGPGGRVILRDVAEAPATAPAARAPGAPASARAPAASGTGRLEATTVPVSMMRKTIAKRLTAAKNEAPHFYLTVSANLAKLDDWRRRLNDEAAKDSGAQSPKVSINDLLILAVARALRLHPMVNASWQGETILLHGQVHVAMAVALPEGLVTPVIRGTDELGVRAIAEQTRTLAQKAKEGKLPNEAYAGGTFTVSNLGMLGIEAFTAIINPPQVAILAVGAAIKMPWVDEHGAVVAQTRMTMTLSCDHRVVDGATGARFLKTLVAYLEDPLRMMA